MLDITKAYGLTFLLPMRDNGVGRILRTYGEFARVEMELISSFIEAAHQPGTMLDVGANIGSIALPLAARHAHWRVIAIEAQRPLAQVLAANALNNGLANVDVHNVAAGSAPGLAEFPCPLLADSENFGVMGFWVGERVRNETVRVVTLDAIAPDDTRFVKMDVEGFESEVLAGSRRLIETIRPNWLLEAAPKNAEAAKACMKTFFAAGYRLFWFFSPLATPSGIKSAPPSGDAGDFCFLAVPGSVPVGWALPEITADQIEWPMKKSAFPCLIRYGMTGVTKTA